MKEILTITSLLILLSSCGSQNDEAKKTSVKNTVTSEELSIEEEQLAERLITLGSMEQIDLMKTLSSLPRLDQYTLKKLDRIIDISCTQSTGLCTFSSKE